jgi:tetratricopeptide (TPR) repeat protein
MFAEADKLAVSDPEKATALYKKSILRFERIIKEGGIENGKLYYDLGNIYFRTKDIGRAILNYRRAEQYIGNDVNLQQNLEFARNTRKDHIEEKQQTKILKTLFFWHYDFSAKTRLILFTVSFILLWFFSIICIFIKKPFFKWSISITAAASVLFAGSLLIDYVTFKKSIPGVIISQEVVARKGNSESYKKSFKDPLHAGTEFTLLEHRGNWLQVELPDARTCWLPASDVEVVR